MQSQVSGYAEVHPTRLFRSLSTALHKRAEHSKRTSLETEIAKFQTWNICSQPSVDGTFQQRVCCEPNIAPPES